MADAQVDVLIVGGGPAGMVAACLLARQGFKVLVAERNENFDREFRGEILQPRFHKMMMDVGLHDHLKRYPHERVDAAHIYFDGRKVGGVNLAELDPASDTTWWMTQPNLLNALHAYAKKFANYELRFNAKVKELHGSHVTLDHDREIVQVNAKVVIGADGRFSTLRRLGDFAIAYDHHDLDVLWFTLPRPSNYDHVFSFFLTAKHNYLILPKYPSLLQCGLVLKAGEFVEMKRLGIEPLKQQLKRAHPIFSEFADGLTDFSPFHMLKGNRDCLREWAREGLIMIGDAAHTCSPAGGIGVAIAVETACVAAGVIVNCFKKGDFSKSALSEVQKARQCQVKKVHAIQGRVRFFLRVPGQVRRWLWPLIRVINSVRLLSAVAGQVLIQQEDIPLYGLSRGSLFSDALTVRQALDIYFGRSGFGRETYTSFWVRLPVGPFNFYLPNIGPRRDVVPLHDVDHVLSEYGVDWPGEMAITGYELGSGLGRYWFGWIIDLQGIWIGVFLFPRIIFKGFVRGRRSGSVYKTFAYSEDFLNKSLGEVRDAVNIAPKDGLTWGASDIFAFAGMLLLSLIVHAPVLAGLVLARMVIFRVGFE